MVNGKKSLYYLNSHGGRHVFITRKGEEISLLKTRKFVYVLPEVVEIIDRVQKRSWKEIGFDDVCMELHVNPETIRSIFRYLVRTGLVGNEETIPLSASDVENGNTLLDGLNNSKTIYPILRAVKEEDYGTINKQKKGKEHSKF